MTLPYIQGGNTAMRVEVSDVKDKLPELVGLIVSEQEDDIVISIHGIPAVKMERYIQPDVSKRIGVAKGKFIVPDDFDTMMSDEIAEMFGVN